MNMKKYQSGGQAPVTFLQYRGLPMLPDGYGVDGGDTGVLENTRQSVSDRNGQSNRQGNGNKQSNKLSIGSILPKEVLSTIIKEGLPNDVDATLNVIGKIMVKYENAETINPTEADLDYLQIMGLVNKISFNAKKWHETSNIMKSNDSFGEVAVTDEGQAVVQDNKSGKIKLVSSTELAKHSDKYYVYSNNELMNMRARNVHFTFDNTIFDQLQSNVSPKKIKEFISSYIINDKFNSVKLEGDINFDEKGNVLNAIAPLLQDKAIVAALSTSNTSHLVTKEQKDNYTQVKKAMETIITMLPKNYVNYLKIKSAQRGIDPSKGVVGILAGIIYPNLSSSSTYIFKPTDKKKDPKDEKDNPLKGHNKQLHIQKIMDYPSYNKTQLINFGNTVTGYSTGPVSETLMTNDNKVINRGLFIDTVLNKESELAPILDMNNAVIFKGKVADVEQGKEANVTTEKVNDYLPDIYYNGTGWSITNMPIKSDGSIDTRLFLKTDRIIKDFTFYSRKHRYIVASEGSNGKYYQLTDEGKEHLENMLKNNNLPSDALVLDHNTGLLTFRNARRFAKIDVGIAGDAKWYSRIYGNTYHKDILNDNEFVRKSDDDTYVNSVTKAVEETDKDIDVDNVFKTAMFIPLVTNPETIIQSIYDDKTSVSDVFVREAVNNFNRDNVDKLNRLKQQQQSAK